MCISRRTRTKVARYYYVCGPSSTRAVTMHDYLEWKKSTTKNPMTVVHYERWIVRFNSFRESNQLDFTLSDVMRFKEHLVSLGSSPKNTQYGLQLLRDYISYNVVMHNFQFPLKLLKIPQERSNTHPHITYDMYLRMIDELPLNQPLTLQRRLMISLLWDTGMRGGELLNLRISNLKERGCVIENEKNHRSRMISWSEGTAKLIKFYLPLRNNLPVAPDKNGVNDWLFVSFNWKPCKKMNIRNLERVVEDLREKLEIPEKVVPHSFRHGFVHRKLREGKAITTVAQMLGHSSSVNVMQYHQMNSRELNEAWGLA